MRTALCRGWERAGHCIWVCGKYNSVSVYLSFAEGLLSALSPSSHVELGC